MRPIFHDSKAKLQRIRAEARQVAGDGLKDVSDVKRDGNVIVKFRSTEDRDSLSITFDFIDRARGFGWEISFDAATRNVTLHIDQITI